jgi:hypothetical protein
MYQNLSMVEMSLRVEACSSMRLPLLHEIRSKNDAEIPIISGRIDERQTAINCVMLFELITKERLCMISGKDTAWYYRRFTRCTTVLRQPDRSHCRSPHPHTAWPLRPALWGERVAAHSAQ